jgi:hypothetical protein
MSRIDALDNTTSYLKWVILAMMRREGRDFGHCELCGDPIPAGKHQIHHTRYDGATYYDLKIVDAKCNQAPASKNLI